MIGPMLRMTLIPDHEMMKSTIPVFFDLLEQEFKARGNFRQVGVMKVAQAARNSCMAYFFAHTFKMERNFLGPSLPKCIIVPIFVSAGERKRDRKSSERLLGNGGCCSACFSDTPP